MTSTNLFFDCTTARFWTCRSKFDRFNTKNIEISSFISTFKALNVALEVALEVALKVALEVTFNNVTAKPSKC